MGRLPDADLAVWDSVIAETPIRFRSTDADTAMRYRSRLSNDPAQAANRPALHFSLIETERIGWAPIGASAIWQQDAESLQTDLASAGLAALMPKQRSETEGYPWVFLDPSTGCGATFVRTVSDLPPWEAGSPFSLLFHLAYAWRGCRLLHAATLGLDGRGILLVGPGGAGKSAATLAGLQAGLQTTGDDYVILQPQPVPTAWPVYRLIKQSPAGLARFPKLRNALSARPPNWHGKIEFDPEPIFPGCWAPSLELDAIVLAGFEGGAVTRVCPTRPTTVFSAMAASMLPQLPGARMAGFSLLTRLSRALPVLEAKFSTDPVEVGEALLRLVKRGAS